MIYEISTDKPISLSLCENNTVKSILQNIALLISTKKGTVPMYRNFGLPMNFIGRPFLAAETIAAQEISDAISTFEKRATLHNVKLEGDISEFGKIKITVEVDI